MIWSLPKVYEIVNVTGSKQNRTPDQLQSPAMAKMTGINLLIIFKARPLFEKKIIAF